MVVGELRPEPLLEAGSLAFHAAVMRKKPAVVPGPSLRCGVARSTDRVTQIPVSPLDQFHSFGTFLLRELLFPAEDAACSERGSGLESRQITAVVIRIKNRHPYGKRTSKSPVD